MMNPELLTRALSNLNRLEFQTLMERDALTKPWWLLPAGYVHPAWWLPVLGLFLWFDYVAGPNTPIPVLYVVPAVLVAWYSGPASALLLAIAIPLFHTTLLAFWWQPTNWLSLAAATLARGLVI